MAGLMATKPQAVVKKSPAAVAPGRVNLLDAIRTKGGKAGLKKAAQPDPKAEEGKAAGAGGMAGLFGRADVQNLMQQAMGKRRNAMDDDDDDDDDDWGDDSDSD